MVIVFLGPPGSGKGTQSRLLSDALRLPHISTGEALREAVRTNSLLSQRLREQMNAGSFVSDRVVAEIVAQRVQERDCRKGFILDGFPRTLAQAETLKELLEEIGFPQPLVFNLGVDEIRLEERVSGRLTCPVCQEIYHSVSHSPRLPGRCDRCHTGLEARADDSRGVLRERIADFHLQTEPLVAYYRQRGALVDILGDKDIRTVGSDVLAWVNGRASRAASRAD